MRYKYILLFIATLGWFSCTDEDFADAYPDPSKINETTVERQFTGVLVAGQDYIVPNYWNYFVVLMGTLNPWTQSIGWVNAPNQYIPGSSGVGSFWDNYYDVLTQYREMQKVWAETDAERRQQLQIFRMAGDVFVYGQTARMVDLFETIPFFEAGLLSTNGGDYNNSYAPFDNGSEIYSFLLDELKSIANEFNSIDVSDATVASFRSQDIVNTGDVELWQRYTNSLRLRLLTRVSQAPDFASRANSEIGEILSNPGSFPLVESNDQNIMIDVFDPQSPINARGFQQGINSDGWDGDDAGQKMIEFLKASNDPRLPLLFEPGINANGEYTGLDPLMGGSDQQILVNDGLIAFYNRRTTSENQYFPGVMMSASEVSFYKAEYYTRNGDEGAAKEAYEKGIAQSVDFYLYVNSISNAANGVVIDSVATADIMSMLGSDLVNWDNASSTDEKISLIAHQKWIHYNIVQPYENWAEVRRLNAPQYEFWVDNSNNQTLPPARWVIPGGEITFNTNNYQAIEAQDDLNNKVFWDIE